MFLLDHGANPNAWDMWGRTPLYVAVDMNSIANRGFLGFGGVLPPAPKDKASGMDVINRLLTLGAGPNHEMTRMRPNAAGRGRFGEYMLRGGTTALMVASLGYDDAAILPPPPARRPAEAAHMRSGAERPRGAQVGL